MQFPPHINLLWIKAKGRILFVWGCIRKCKWFKFIIRWVLPASIPFVVLLLQFTPLLTVSGVSGGFSPTGKIYFYIKNIGSIPAHSITGRFVITSHAEGEAIGITERERVIGGNLMDTGRSVIFFPTGQEGKPIPLMYPANIKEPIGEDFIYLSIYFEYAQFKSFPWFIRHCYEGVFQYDDIKENILTSDGKITELTLGKGWVASSQTMYPNFFAYIFKSLRKSKEPILPFQNKGGNKMLKLDYYYYIYSAMTQAMGGLIALVGVFMIFRLNFDKKRKDEQRSVVRDTFGLHAVLLPENVLERRVEERLGEEKNEDTHHFLSEVWNIYILYRDSLEYTGKVGKWVIAGLTGLFIFYIILLHYVGLYSFCQFPAMFIMLIITVIVIGKMLDYILNTLRRI